MTSAPTTVETPVVPSATMGGERKRPLEQITLALLIFVPFVAIAAAVPVVWGWGLGWRDVQMVDLGGIDSAAATEMMMSVWMRVRVARGMDAPPFNWAVNSG